MSLLFFDGFDGNGHGTGKWDTWNGSISSDGGRNGTNGVLFTCNSTACSAKFFASKSTIILGLAVTVSTSDPSINQISFREGSTTHIGVRIIQSVGQINIYRNTTLIAQSDPGVVSSSSIHYLEFKVTPHDSTGEVIVRVDGTEEINFTGDTRNGGTGVIDNVSFGGQSGGGGSSGFRFDDLYVCDTLGSDNNDFLGDVVVETKRPNGNGNYSDFVGQDANSTDNYLNVDETSSDGDTTYNEADTALEKDSYSMADISASEGSVLGVQVNSIAKHTGGGGTFRHLVRRTSTDAFGTAKTPGASYDYAGFLWEQDPIATADWTIATVDASEFGVEIVS